MNLVVTEDFYLPVRGQQAGTEIDTLKGLEYTAIDDIKYLRESFFVPLYATAKQSGQELDLASINVECTKWLNEVANQRIHQTTKHVPAELLNKEREVLAIMHSSYFRSTDYKQDVIYSIVVPQHDLTVYENIERSL